MQYRSIIISILTICGIFSIKAQQDPQFTQYVYNTQIVNPGYIGSLESLNFNLLYRTQWLNFEGAPKTGTFTTNFEIESFENVRLGLSIVRDEIGPAVETYFNIDYSYTINVSQSARLSFGLKGGVDILDVDFTKLNAFDQTDVFQNNIDNRFQPQFGVGMFYYTDKFYVGLSAPNMLTTRHFDENVLVDSNFDINTTPTERVNYFLMAGYVFDLNNSIKFKPATLIKAVSGAPLQWDVSANFLFYDKFTLGAAYRWGAAVSGLAGFQISQDIFIGFAYDYEATDISQFSSGSYEAILRFNILKKSEGILTPRFF